MEEFEIVIIGGGAAGFSAAIKADELGVKTLMVNSRKIGLGGTCVNVGCIPTKYLLHLTKIIYTARNTDFPGLTMSHSTRFDEIIKGKNKLVSSLRKRKYSDVLENLENVSFLEGDAYFISKDKIKVDGTIVKGKKFIICTGSSTTIPSIEGIESVKFITHIELLSLNKLPKSLLVVGGGPQAVELAQIFSRLGAKVYMFKRSSRILKREEPVLSNMLKKYLEEEGIEIYTNSRILRVTQRGDYKLLDVDIDGEKEVFEGHEILIAAGRKSNTKRLGLENTGVRIGDSDEIIVDEEMQAAENIWAAGDVTGEPMLETVAAREGMIAANNAISTDKIKMDYKIVPHAVFTDPQLASVGYTDYEAVRKGFKCRCNTVPMSLVPKAMAIKATKGAIKMVIDNESNEILGIHILSSEAANIIHEGVMILKNKMSVDDVINTIHVFPTLSESIKIAAQSFRKDITKMSCCVE